MIVAFSFYFLPGVGHFKCIYEVNIQCGTKSKIMKGGKKKLLDKVEKRPASNNHFLFYFKNHHQWLIPVISESIRN